MGIDITVIIGHNLKANEIIQLPKIIDTWTDLRNVDITNGYFRESQWESTFSEEELIASWESHERAFTEIRLYDEDDSYFTEYGLSTYFGRLVFNRKTLIISYSPEKYANLFYPDICRVYLLFSRILAKKFEQDTIIYCVDSSYPTSSIEDLSTKGKDILSIIEFANREFGVPPDNLVEGIKNLYFIDYTYKPLQTSRDISWSECRWH